MDPSFARILDHLAGREDAAVARFLAGEPEVAERARRLLDAGRRAMRAPQPSRKALRRAARIFSRRETPRPSVLGLVLDSLLRPAPALRTAATQRVRFLRFEGEAKVELQIAPVHGGVELRGQVTPADFSVEVVVRWDGGQRKGKVDSNGTFHFARLPRRTVDLEIGAATIRGLEM